jgi:hypothetical protein
MGGGGIAVQVRPSVVCIIAGHRPAEPSRQRAVPIAQPTVLLTNVRSLAWNPDTAAPVDTEEPAAEDPAAGGTTADEPAAGEPAEVRAGAGTARGLR